MKEFRFYAVLFKISIVDSYAVLMIWPCDTYSIDDMQTLQI